MHKLALTIILAIAFALRVVNLPNNPPALYWDEVGLGYNAYSILLTGRDEHGRAMPFDYFLSFRDYKPPVYVYATAPFIAILGLNEWSVRLPSALAGTLSVLITYLLTRELLQKFTFTNSRSSSLVPLIAAFLIAISPWSIQISRAAYEANLGQLLTSLGVLLFLISLRQSKTIHKTLLLSASALSFVLTFYTFNSNRVFSPLLVILLALLYGPELISSHQSSPTRSYHRFLPVVLACLLGLLLVLPLAPHVLSKEGQIRYQEVNIFSNPEPLELSQQRIDRAGNTFFANIFNNRRVYYAQEWLSGYFAHFRGDFLFIKGDINPRFSSGDIGQLYLATLPLILIGLYFSAVKLGKPGVLLIGWLLLSPVPAAFAREVPHALRTLHVLPVYDILAALGFIVLYSPIQHQSRKVNKLNFSWPKFGVVSLCAVLALQFFYFLYNYHKYYPIQTANEWQYGYKPMVAELVKLQDQYQKIVVTNEKGRAYINVLFYQQYPPSKFQQQKQYSYDELGLFEVSAFDKYEFRSVDWLNEIRSIQSNDKVLVVGTPSEVKFGKWTKASVLGLDRKPVFILNEIPQGFENATEQGIFEDLELYNAFHNTNYTIDKEKRWVIDEL